MEHNLKYSDLNMISPNCFPPKEFCLSGDEPIPKVRKPYTISKQRERWTGEEHEKFLEGLKLHGRAWRKIEEHIGSKTAVQIRSHAQKFFSKVIKETSECNGDSTNTVEIPPPRPKRKPSHPYPRKLTNKFKKEILDSEKQETCTLAISSVSPKVRKLTLSVTSMPFSETVGSSISNVLNGCASPVLSAEASNQSEFLNMEKDTFLPSPSSFGYCKSSSLVQQTADASSQDSCSTKLESGSKGSDCTMEEMSMDAPTVCIKLFGQTVVVPDSNRTSSSTNSTTPLDTNPFSNNESPRGDLESPNNLGVYYVHTLPTTGTWDACPIGLAPMSYYNQISQGDNAIRPFVHIPLWAWCGNLPLPFTNPKHTAPAFCMDNMDRSCSSSNSADTSDNSDATNSISLFHLGRSESFNSSKGFVPYKRYLSDKDANDSKINNCEEPDERLPNLYV